MGPPPPRHRHPLPRARTPKLGPAQAGTPSLGQGDAFAPQEGCSPPRQGPPGHDTPKQGHPVPTRGRGTPSIPGHPGRDLPIHGHPQTTLGSPPPHHGHTRTPRNTPGHPGTGTLGPSEHGPPPPWVTPAHGHPQHPGVPLGTQAGPSPPVPHRGCPSGLTWGARCQAGGMSGRRRSSTAKRRSWAPVGLAPNSASYASRNAGTGAPAGRDGGGQRGWVGGGGCSQGSRGGHPWVLTGAEGLAA